MSRIALVTVLMVLLDTISLYCIRRAFPIFYTRYRKNFLAWYFAIHALFIAGVLLGFFAPVPRLMRTIAFVGLFILYFSKIFTLLAVIPMLLSQGGTWIIDRFFTSKSRELSASLTVMSNDRTEGRHTVTAVPQTSVKQPAPVSESHSVTYRDDKEISRSTFLARGGLALAALPLISLNAGMVKGVYDYRIRRQRLIIPQLPGAFEGMTIVQISDIHSGSFYNKKAVNQGIDLLLGLKADLIFFTGDLVNDRTSEMKDYQDVFSRVKAPLGVYSVLGNHDYGDYVNWPSEHAKAKNLEDLKKVHKLMGFNLLLNEHRRLKIGNDEIGILGVENWGALSHFPKYGRVDLALAGTQDLSVKLLLSHDPSHWQAKIIPLHKDINVMFSGHTHGMQMGIRLTNFQWSPIQYVYPEWAGLYSHGHQQLYVNVGYGFLGYPGRIGILPEITLFTLGSKA